MDNNDKKDIAKIIGQVIDQKVAPRLDKIEGKLSKVETSNQAIMEQVVQNSEDITIMQDNIKDTLLTEERIETKVDASIRRQDDLSIKYDQVNRRVLKVESKKS